MATPTLPLGSVHDTRGWRRSFWRAASRRITARFASPGEVSLKQFVKLGLEKQMAVGGALFELETLRAVSDEARLGWWTMEPAQPRNNPLNFSPEPFPNYCHGKTI